MSMFGSGAAWYAIIGVVKSNRGTKNAVAGKEADTAIYGPSLGCRIGDHTALDGGFAQFFLELGIGDVQECLDYFAVSPAAKVGDADPFGSLFASKDAINSVNQTRLKAHEQPIPARAACASTEASDAGKRAVTSASVMQASDDWPNPFSEMPSFKSAVGAVGPLGVPE